MCFWKKKGVGGKRGGEERKGKEGDGREGKVGRSIAFVERTRSPDFPAAWCIFFGNRDCIC